MYVSWSIVPLYITLFDFKISEPLLIYQSLTVVLLALRTLFYNRLSLTTGMINLGLVSGKHLKDINSTEFQ